MLSGCEKDKPKDKYEFIEYIELRGFCREDHVGLQPVEYTGHLVHWFNVTKKNHSLFGTVFRAGDITERVLEEVKTPHKYHPPYIIEFSGLTANQTAGENFTLKGISDHTSVNAKYESTCNLKVVKRLDYLPDTINTGLE